ncbi:MAG: hypothetical protein AAF581_14395 [Planctomycetota bacterium]
MAPPTVVLLGPQKPKSVLHSTVADITGSSAQPLAVITAGWQEDENDVAELDAQLGRPTRNLALYQRSDLVFAKYPQFRAGLWERKALLDQMHAGYKVQLAGALDSIRTLQEVESDNPAVLSPYLADAIATLQEIDRRHFERMAQVTAEFDSDQGYGANSEIVRHREEIRQIIEGSSALLVAGGHVLVLLNRLRIFAIAELLTQIPVIGWSAGAMALSERVVLFHHFPAQGSNNTAVAAAGVGIAPGIVPFPNARHRLDLDSPGRVALLARRFAPARCIALDAGQRVDWDGQQWHGHGTSDSAPRLLTPAGDAVPLEGSCP